MVMRQPVGRLQVYLHISHPHGSCYAHLSIEEVGPCIAVLQSGVDNLNLLPFCGGKSGQWEELMLPYIM